MLSISVSILVLFSAPISVLAAMLVIVFTTKDIQMNELEPPRIAAAYWEQLGSFVREAVADSASHIPYREAELFRAATGLALWAWQSAGLPLERELVFSRNTIDRFVSQGLSHYANSGRATRRSQLLRMGEKLLGPKLMPPKLRPIGVPDALAPYSASEVIALKSWARVQSPDDRRLDAEVLLALGFGAGLAAREIAALRSCDIVVDPDGLLINVAGDRPRTVPLLCEWERAILELCASSDPEQWAFRPGRTKAYKNLITNFIAWSGASEIFPQSTRMRSTWVVGRLDAGVPMMALVRASGVRSLSALARYEGYVSGMESDDERHRLSGRPS